MLSLFGVSHIPVEVLTTSYYEYRWEEVVYTEAQARDLAYSDLKAQLDVVLTNAELISKSVTTSCDDQYYYLRCKIYCKEDIAEEKEFYISK